MTAAVDARRKRESIQATSGLCAEIESDRNLPVAEEVGVRLCIHPHDPPFSLFGRLKGLAELSGVMRGVSRFMPAGA